MTTIDSKPNKLSWSQFDIHNQSDTCLVFESLCEELFARYLLTKPADLVVHHNQTGVECEPFKKGEEFWSFQAKHKAEGSIDFSAFHESIEKALELKAVPGRYEELTQIICYTNRVASENKSGKLRKSNVRDKIKQISNDADVEIKWMYGNAILKRLEENEYSDIRKKYFGGGQNLKLRTPISKATRTISALKFNAQVTAFRGRDSERKQIDDFLCSEDLVSCWAIEGLGASGKSRLALELCIGYTKKGWKCGFYDKDTTGSSPQRWDPEQPHLVVFDYAMLDEAESIKLIKQALHLSDGESRHFPVRILLVDRDAKTTIEKIRDVPTFGEQIKGCFYPSKPLEIKPPTNEDLRNMILDLTEYFELSPEKRQLVIDYTMQSESTRKILIAGLASLNLYQGGTHEPAIDMGQLIGKLINRERDMFWRKIGIEPEQEKYLLIATMSEGIDRSQIENFGSEAKSFIEKFDFEEGYEKVVGESANQHLASLSHDLISEYYVLISFKPADLADEKRFHETIRICMELDGGKGLIGFITRAANDWPNHPTFNFLLPRFGQTEAEFTLWLAVITNIIDKINIPVIEKLGIFNRTVWGLIRDDESIFVRLKHVFEGFFLRLLRETTNNIALDKWVRPYVVLDESMIKLPPSSRERPKGGAEVNISESEIPANLNLKPNDYCQAVISSFTKIDKDHRKKLIWHGLFETYFHTIIHTLANRNMMLEDVRRILSDIAETFNDSWSIGIIFRDVIAGLVQFNHANKNPDFAIEITDWMIDQVYKRKNRAGLASCLSAATTTYSISRAPYNKKKEIIRIFDDAFGKSVESDEVIGTEYVGATVALMHGFRDRSDFEFASKLAQRAQRITRKFPSAKNVEHLNMSLGQLSRRERDIASVEEADKFLSKTVSLAKQHWKIVPSLASRAVSEISTKYVNEIQRYYQKAHTYFKMGINLCDYFSDASLSNNKLYPFRLLEGEFNYALNSKNFDLLRKLVHTVNKLQNNTAVDISHFLQAQSTLFNAYNSSKNNSDDKTTSEIAGVAEYWLEHLSDNTQIKPIFSHIIQDREQVKRGGGETL